MALSNSLSQHFGPPKVSDSRGLSQLQAKYGKPPGCNPPDKGLKQAPECAPPGTEQPPVCRPPAHGQAELQPPPPPEPEQPHELTPPPLRHWRDSAPVVRLSEFLKANAPAGIRLLEDNGDIVLRFEPGLTPKQTERWQIALQAEELLFEALDDLTTLVKRGLLRLPKG